MSVREKGRRRPVRSRHVPSHVPSHPQNAAKVRGFSRTASAFTAETDCLPEEAGFEPMVPLTADAGEREEKFVTAEYEVGGAGRSKRWLHGTGHPIRVPVIDLAR